MVSWYFLSTFACLKMILCDGNCRCTFVPFPFIDRFIVHIDLNLFMSFYRCDGPVEERQPNDR